MPLSNYQFFPWDMILLVYETSFLTFIRYTFSFLIDNIHYTYDYIGLFDSLKELKKQPKKEPLAYQDPAWSGPCLD